MRAFIAELGPLLWIALATAVLPTTGLLLLLAHLADVTANWPVSVAGAALGASAIALATGCVLLPPSICAFVAGYLLGAPVGTTIAVLGIGGGGVLGARIVWPLLGRRIYAFMRARPRVHAVQALMAVPPRHQVLRVAALRNAAKLPFSVISLLLSAASAPARAVWLGSTIGAVPLAWLVAGIGSAWRRWCDHGSPPSWLELASLGLAVSAVLAATIAARRTVHQAPATG